MFPNRYVAEIERERKKCFKELEGFTVDNSIITLEVLKSLELNKWYYMSNDAGRYRKIKHTNHSLTFITEMVAGGSFSMHKHNCSEFVRVLSGDLIDDKNSIYLQEEDVYIYPPYRYHKPYCTVDSVYEVIFT